MDSSPLQVAIEVAFDAYRRVVRRLQKIPRRPRYHRSMVGPQRVLAYVLAHPNATIGEIPRACGYKNQETISRLINTPKFQETWERCVSRAYAQVLLTQSDRIRFESRLSHQIGGMTESIDDFDVSIFDVVAGTTTID
jgi:hypothetical protein